MTKILLGDPGIFAIESSITTAYERLSIRALGYFSLHIGDHIYGVRGPNATMLACSFDEVKRRILRRSKHTVPFSEEPDATLIATAVYDSIYRDNPEPRMLSFLPQELKKLVYSQHLLWAPDGDKAFDDSSYVLHFDVDGRVRLIAFKLSKNNSYTLNPQTLRDQWLDADVFYAVLNRWVDAFEFEWTATPKTPEIS